MLNNLPDPAQIDVPATTERRQLTVEVDTGLSDTGWTLFGNATLTDLGNGNWRAGFPEAERLFFCV